MGYAKSAPVALHGGDYNTRRRKYAEAVGGRAESAAPAL